MKRICILNLGSCWQQYDKVEREREERGEAGLSFGSAGWPEWRPRQMRTTDETARPKKGIGVMCAVLHLPDRDIENLGELRGLMRKLVREASYGEIPKGAHWCLCPVDLEATGRANGLKVVKEAYGHYRVTGQTDRE